MENNKALLTLAEGDMTFIIDHQAYDECHTINGYLDSRSSASALFNAESFACQGGLTYWSINCHIKLGQMY